MLELMKKSTTKESTEICLRIPTKDSENFMEMLTSLLRFAKYEIKEIENDDEILFPLKDVLPESTPASNLRGARFREDLTQKELAEKVETHESNISAMERGVRPISKKMALKLGEVLNVKYQRFL